jgi:hypothetical protein
MVSVERPAVQRRSLDGRHYSKQVARTLDEIACDHQVEIEGEVVFRLRNRAASWRRRSESEGQLKKLVHSLKEEEAARLLDSPGITVSDSHKRDAEATKA